MDREWVSDIGDVLAEVGGVLASLSVDAGARELATDGERLALTGEVLGLAGRLRSVAALLVAEVDSAEVSVREHGIATASWLAEARRMTRREAFAWLHEGRALVRSVRVREAQLSGEVSPEQGRAISRVLERLPEDLAPDQLAAAEEQLVGYASTFDAAGLGVLARHVVEVVAPEVAEESESRWLEREAKAAERGRHLTFTGDGHGSVLLRGSLPVLQAELLIAQVDAFAHLAHRRALDALDPLTDSVTPPMRRADALVAMAEMVALHRDAPVHGGDRPRIVVMVGLDRLERGAAAAGVLPSGHRLTAGELRRLCCDADVLPVVLGGAPQVLDVGRDERLVTDAIRAALTVRDGGCTFPGCDKPPAQCHAHHLVPWWAGGATSLENLVLVCAQHHRVVEPTSQPVEHRWHVELGPDGIPQVRPPRRVDRDRAPRRHQRFRIPRASPLPVP